MGEIIDKNGRWAKLVKEMYSSKDSYTEVGYQNTEKKEHDSDVKVVDVAIWNEFGTTKMPSRSFVRSYFDANTAQISSMCKQLLNSVIIGKKTTKQGLGLLGEFIKSGIQLQIDKVFLPPLNPTTIKRKGSTKPLIDTGQMRASVTHTEHIKGS